MKKGYGCAFLDWLTCEVVRKEIWVGGCLGGYISLLVGWSARAGG